MQFFAISDKGKVRSKNEDYCLAKEIGDYTMFVLADGMGGHSGGEIASKQAVSDIESFLSESLTERLFPAQISLLLKKAVAMANSHIIFLAEDDNSLEGMGTTCDVCVVLNGVLLIAHIGDSRVYKITSKGEIVRLTRDHSLIEHMIEMGLLSSEEAENHPQKNIILKALGSDSDPVPDLIQDKLSAGDTLLLCSDGLTNMLSDETILKVVREERVPDLIAQKLVKMANEAGGKDNISIIVANEEG